jgi:hypothetical protein
MASTSGASTADERTRRIKLLCVGALGGALAG